ncbi:MAG TPA: MarR family transcriptional regulator [Steroidobacteraceae bacterium]|nr:MarR family transcriptional regulator [Steroidobacteraceae bacterium]
MPRSPRRLTAAADPADLEMRAGPGDHEALRLWLRLLATTNLIEKRVRRLLEDQFATTLPRFDLMAQLDRVPEGLMMGELSRRMMVSGGNVTGIADLLEKDGLVERIADPRDGRAALLRLTEPGRRRFRAMAGRHERWIVATFAGMGRTDLAKLATLLAKLKASARNTEGTEPS